MNLKKRGIIITLLFITSFIAPLFSFLLPIPNGGSHLITNPDTPLQVKFDSPVVIDGNYWLGQNASSGYGNSTHPYIIENLIIDLTAYSTDGITIINTDAYFIINNCEIYNGDSWEYGISLDNVTNGKIMNCHAYNNTYGINLNYVFNSTFTENNVSANEISGFVVKYSVNNTFTHNLMNDNGAYGIYLEDGSHYSTLINNTAHGDPTRGFSLRESDYIFLIERKF